MTATGALRPTEARWLSGNSCPRVLRGGSWNDDPASLRSAIRSWSSAGNRYDIIGFRVARTMN